MICSASCRSDFPVGTKPVLGAFRVPDTITAVMATRMAATAAATITMGFRSLPRRPSLGGRDRVGRYGAVAKSCA